MPLKILPLTEADCDAWARLYYPAFSTMPIGVLWHSEPSEESLDKFADVLRGGVNKPEAHIFKCVDTDLNDKLIAVAKWSVFEKPRSMDEVEQTFVLRPTFKEENQQARLEFMQGIWQSRREYMAGNPHVMLDTLICHPDHHRRGAGRMLVQWGLDKADELGLPAYLEGSMAGVRLYKSVGYVPQREFVFDATKYGGKTPDIHTAMIRPPQKVAATAA